LYRPLRAEELAQGDILESVEFFHPKRGDYKDVVRAQGIVLSHSCDFTKYREDERKGRSNLDRVPLIVSPMLQADDLPDQGTAGHAKKGRVARYFYLPAEEPLPSNQLVDFWFMQPCAVHELLEIRRIASLTDDWQKMLQRGLDRFFSWEDRKQPIPEIAA
jgi:hypothetical protein